MGLAWTLDNKREAPCRLSPDRVGRLRGRGSRERSETPCAAAAEHEELDRGRIQIGMPDHEPLRRQMPLICVGPSAFRVI